MEHVLELKNARFPHDSGLICLFLLFVSFRVLFFESCSSSCWPGEVLRFGGQAQTDCFWREDFGAETNLQRNGGKIRKMTYSSTLIHWLPKNENRVGIPYFASFSSIVSISSRNESILAYGLSLEKGIYHSKKKQYNHKKRARSLNQPVRCQTDTVSRAVISSIDLCFRNRKILEPKRCAATSF